MVVNGVESYPGVSGGVLPLSCCQGGALQATTATFAWSITVRWINSTFELPASLDLANVPVAWRVDVLIGCPPISEPCVSPQDSYTSGLTGTLSGLTGTLQLSGAIGSYDMSLCLSLAESLSSLHPLVHTLQLYVPHVHAGY